MLAAANKVTNQRDVVFKFDFDKTEPFRLGAYPMDVSFFEAHST